MTVPEHQTRVEVWKGRTGWAWWCQVHRCAATEMYQRHGNATLWTTAQYAADAHARQYHHAPVCHDL